MGSWLLPLLSPLAACDPSSRGAGGHSPGSQDLTPLDPGEAAFGAAQRAVVLVLDGVRMEESFGEGESDAWGGPTAEILPAIREDLRPLGAAAEPAYVTGTTFTSSSHADLLTGVRQYFANMGASEGYGMRWPDHPTLFELLREQRDLGAEQAVLAANTTILGDLTHSHAPGFGSAWAGSYLHVSAPNDEAANSHDDADVVDRVRAALRNDGAAFVLANLHQIDRAGHAKPQDYAGYVADADSPVVGLWQDLVDAQRAGADLPLVVVVSDHGRHRFLEELHPWQDHGCSCTGCREVPLLLLGPGIEAGAVATRPYLLEDVTHTVAWLMGLELPYSTGLGLDELLAGDPDVPVRSGAVALAADGALVAWQRWEPDHEARSGVWIDDRELAAGPLHVERPTVARGKDQDFVCWRQLELVESAERWPWEARCAARVQGETGWRDLGFPETLLPDGFEAQLQVDARGRLWALWIGGELNPGLDAITPSTVGMQLARWDGRSWESPSRKWGLERFPSHPDLLIHEERVWAAVAISDETTSMRYSRHIELFGIDWPEEAAPSWRPLVSLRPSEGDDEALGRVERPALGRAGDELLVAAVGYRADGTTLVVSRHDLDSGDDRVWSRLSTLDGSGGVFPHLGPAFSADGWLYWARQSGGGGVEICRVDAAEAEPDCRDSGYAWIDSLAPAEDGAWASVSDGDLSWARVWVPFPAR